MPQNHRRKAKWVFCAVASEKYPDGDQQIFERRLLRSLKRIGLPESGKLHTFRHSFIFKALAIGAPNATVRVWGGHVSDDILALYTHVLDGQSQSAIFDRNAVSRIDHKRRKAQNHGATNENRTTRHNNALP